jgi:hypothetical protein
MTSIYWDIAITLTASICGGPAGSLAAAIVLALW